MQAHPLPAHPNVEFNDLLDEDFDSLEIRQPFNRKPVREQTSLMCAERAWDDFMDTDDMLCELQA